MTRNSLEEISTEIKKARSVILTGHVSADGDSIGSMLALGQMLQQLQKKVYMVSAEEIPFKYRFLPKANQVLVGKLPENKCDLLVVLDCASPGRLDPAVQPITAATLVVNIDHHADNTLFGNMNYVDSEAAAVGEIVHKLGKQLSVVTTPSIAACLYVAISADTGSFKYQNTRPETLRIAAELMESGLELGQVSARLYEEKTLSSLRLLQAALGTLQIIHPEGNGAIAWMSITMEMEAECKSQPGDVEELINYTRGIAGVEIGILFREMPHGMIKVGFRSKYFANVNEIAAIFGGGGHRRAAGCSVLGTMDAVVSQVLRATEKYLRERRT